MRTSPTWANLLVAASLTTAMLAPPELVSGGGVEMWLVAPPHYSPARYSRCLVEDPDSLLEQRLVDPVQVDLAAARDHARVAVHLQALAYAWHVDAAVQVDAHRDHRVVGVGVFDREVTGHDLLVLVAADALADSGVVVAVALQVGHEHPQPDIAPLGGARREDDHVHLLVGVGVVHGLENLERAVAHAAADEWLDLQAHVHRAVEDGRVRVAEGNLDPVDDIRSEVALVTQRLGERDVEARALRRDGHALAAQVAPRLVAAGLALLHEGG